MEPRPAGSAYFESSLTMFHLISAVLLSSAAMPLAAHSVPLSTESSSVQVHSVGVTNTPFWVTVMTKSSIASSSHLNVRVPVRGSVEVFSDADTLTDVPSIFAVPEAGVTVSQSIPSDLTADQFLFVMTVSTATVSALSVKETAFPSAPITLKTGSSTYFVWVILTTTSGAPSPLKVNVPSRASPVLSSGVTVTLLSVLRSPASGVTLTQSKPVFSTVQATLLQTLNTTGSVLSKSKAITSVSRS